ncbi:surface antigen variable number repeat-containing protein [Ectothiorhodospira sp. PHS-1]|uniref:BamA/TamA family outer membrane protein n=1 Tax=Ectothiorhodospira sp. PHS-1 TaxID=519989 RepID=UPI00024A8101|nr:BamA/TamA family outer membrane protein [Ectothiorhodospira sp. PHS-1]EHQ51461.1 surface antigen variable number repeat-containing protein [Ectothiorhodospira sp. PHS-1]
MIKMWRRIGAGLCALLVVLSGAASAAGLPDDASVLSAAHQGMVISDIRFEGRRITRESVLLQEIVLGAGDVLDVRQLERDRQAIMNLGLFKSVTTRTEEEGGEVRVTYLLEEKYYLFPLPRLSRTSDGDLRFGGELRFDNLLGLNQELRILAEWEDAGNDTTEEESRTLSVDYDIPRLPWTAWGLGISLKDQYTLESESDDGEYGAHREDARQVGLSISRWLDRRGPSAGWRAGLGVSWDSRRYRAREEGVPIPRDGEDVSWSGSLTFSEVNDLGVRREGVAYGARFSWGSDVLGAGRSHQRLDLFYRAYRPLRDDPLTANLNYQARFGIASGTPFGDEAYALGGGGNLRGYPRDYREGDVFMLLNVEYLRPVMGNTALRGVGFMDLGGVWARDDIDLSDIHGSAGLGMRVNLRWFVRTHLRLDYGYAFTTGETRVYAGTSHTF